MLDLGMCQRGLSHTGKLKPPSLHPSLPVCHPAPSLPVFPPAPSLPPLIPPNSMGVPAVCANSSLWALPVPVPVPLGLSMSLFCLEAASASFRSDKPSRASVRSIREFPPCALLRVASPLPPGCSSLLLPGAAHPSVLSLA